MFSVSCRYSKLVANPIRLYQWFPKWAVPPPGGGAGERGDWGGGAEWAVGGR